MQATTSTRVGSRKASCLTVTQWTSITGAYISRMTASATACLVGVAGLEGGDDILRGGDTAEGVVPFGLGLALQEHRGVAGVRDGILDVAPAGRAGWRRRRPGRGSAGWCRASAAGPHRAETGPRAMSGTARITTSASRGRVGLGEAATGLAGALLAGRGVLAVVDGVGAVLQVVGDPHAHLAAGADDGDGQLLLRSCCLAPQIREIVGSTGFRYGWSALSPCHGSQCSMIWLIFVRWATGLGSGGVVEQAVAERAAGKGEPDPAVLAAEREVFDVHVAHVRRDGVDRSRRVVPARRRSCRGRCRCRGWGVRRGVTMSTRWSTDLLVGLQGDCHPGLPRMLA